MIELGDGLKRITAAITLLLSHTHLQLIHTTPDRVASDEVALCANAYKRLTAQSLAEKLGLASAGEAMEGE